MYFDVDFFDADLFMTFYEKRRLYDVDLNLVSQKES